MNSSFIKMVPLAEAIKQTKKTCLQTALELAKGSRKRAQELLGLSSSSFFALLKEFPEIDHDFPAKKAAPNKKITSK